MCPKKVRLYKNNQHVSAAANITDGISQNVTSHLHKKVSKTDTNTTKMVICITQGTFITEYKHNTCILNHVLGIWILSKCNETHTELGLPTSNVMVMYATVP
jgi:hypothetical protein